jgi:methylaspartate mutase sigma subunit
MQDSSIKYLIANRGTIVLGVAASDAHVVGNHLIAMFLRRQRFDVINLGACTPTEEFMRVASKAERLVAVLIGSLNGHALEDLADLPELRHRYHVSVPIIVGGNLSVGAIKNDGVIVKLHALGVDQILQDPRQIVDAIGSLSIQPQTMSISDISHRSAFLLEDA